MSKALQFAKTAQSYSRGFKINGHPPQVRLDRILSLAERIDHLQFESKSNKSKALQICWDSYAKVLSLVDSDLDESWGNAKMRDNSRYQPEISIIDNNALVHRLFYGELDDDGCRE